MKKNEETLKNILQSYVRSDKVGDKYNTALLESVWHKEMSPMINNYTGKINFYKGKLTVEITSAPLRHELHNGRDKIITLLNDVVGIEMVKEIRVY